MSDSPSRNTPSRSDPASSNDSTHDGEGDLGFVLPSPAKLSWTSAITVVLILSLVAGGAFLATYLPRRHAAEAIERETRERHGAPMRLEVVTPKPVTDSPTVMLPGSIEPLEHTAIHPRVSGYVRRWLVDLGERVSEGQLLAEIDTPELDQELSAARAQLAQAEASISESRAGHAYSQSTLQRYRNLADTGVVSLQDLEQRRAQALAAEANIGVSEANIAARQANIRRLVEMKAFSRVMAPFAGTIVRRNIERGALVSPGSTVPLFEVAIVDPVRVFVAAPQHISPHVKTGQAAKISVREFGGKVFEGQVAHTSGALDPASRTLRVEVRVPNPAGELLAGMAAQVALTLPAAQRSLELPGTALIVGAEGVRVAVVDEQDKLRLVPITIARDLGATVWLASGLNGNERVVKNGSSTLKDGLPATAASAK